MYHMLQGLKAVGQFLLVKKILKIFTLYERDGNIGNVTQTI